MQYNYTKPALKLVRGTKHLSAFTHLPSPLCGQIHLALAVVRYSTAYRRLKTGVCSGYLLTCEAGTRVHIGVRRGSFVLPPPEVLPHFLTSIHNLWSNLGFRAICKLDDSSMERALIDRA